MHDLPHDLWIDANGVPTEKYLLGGQEVIVHHDDLPDKDVTVLHGIPCTTALRTVIDIAPDLDHDALRRTVADCLERGLFTVDEALARTSEDDMWMRAGARLLRQALLRP